MIAVSDNPHLDKYLDLAKKSFALTPLKKGAPKKIISMGDSNVQVVGETTPNVIHSLGLNTRYHRRVTNDDGKKLNMQLRNKKFYPGGTMNSLSMVAAKLGSTVELFSNVGKDNNGKFVIQNTYTKNLTPHFTTSRDQNTSVNQVALFGKNKRAGASYIDASLTAVKIPKEKFKGSGFYITNAQYLCDSRNHSTVMENIRHAKNSGAQVILRLENPSLVKDISSTLNSLIKKDYIDIIIGGEAEINALFKMYHNDNSKRPISLNVIRDLVTDTAQKTGKHFVITYGRDGTDIISNEGLFRIKPTHIENIENTLGVGNAFSGGYISALAQGLTNHEAGIIASEVAASAIKSEGPYPSDKSLEEIKRKMLELIKTKKSQQFS